MTNRIIEASELPEGEKIYLKRDLFGYRIVYPIKNEDGKINMVNLLFGGWRNLFFLVLFLLLITGFIYTYQHDTQEMQKVVENPCKYCQNTTHTYSSAVFTQDDIKYFMNVSKNAS